jgi:hypothetical protein
MPNTVFYLMSFMPIVFFVLVFILPKVKVPIQSRGLLLILFIFVSIISGLRDIVFDTETYQKHFLSIGEYSDLSRLEVFYPGKYIEFMDSGYSNLVVLFRFFGVEFEFFSAICTFVFLWCFFALSRYVLKENYVYALAILLSDYLFYQLQYNTMRQGLAIAFCMFAIKFFLQSKIKRGVVIFLLSFTIHIINILPLIILSLRRFYLKCNRRVMFILLFVLLAFYGRNILSEILFILDSLLSPMGLNRFYQKFNFYIHNAKYFVVSPVNVSFMIYLTCFVLINMKLNKLKEAEFDIAMLYSVGFLSMLLLSSFDLLARRLTYPLVILLPIVIPILFKNIQKNWCFDLIFFLAVNVLLYKTLFSSFGWD